MSRGELRALIGGKAANIWVMANELRLPVPPSFTISTDACRAYLTEGYPDGLDDEVRTHMARLEAVVGRKFGDDADPLLVSVRSGAPVSMPGMMDTILNLGLNTETAAGLARQSGDAGFVEACQARFSDMYRDIVAVDTVPDDPWEQLRAAIEAVFRSWNSDRARSYRSREGIPDDLGTAVTVQAMVFGNRGNDSGTGVLFTRNPSTGESRFYGDLLFDAQGEDVVAGTSRTEPISVLDERMPGIAEELRRYAQTLEHHFADMCDIEFTIEQGRLWMLQTRVGKRSPQAALRIAVDMARDEDFPLSKQEAVARVARYLETPPTTAVEHTDARPLASGLGASPGVAFGQVATTPEDAVERADAGYSVILVRRETSPDDVHGMARATGILTATGGLASHAAVVARGWGIPAVVGASTVEISEAGVSIDGATFAAGDTLTIDGSTGEIFAGEVDSGSTIVPEATVLLAWAEELGIDVPEAKVASQGGPRAEVAAANPWSVLRTVLVKGFVTAEDVATALCADDVEPLLEELAEDGYVEWASGMFRLTEEGRTRAMQLIEEDRRSWGAEQTSAALESLVPLDIRMKEIITSWQMREVEGHQTLNDHSDEAYDASVLAAFVSLHEDAAAWLQPLVDRLPRLEAYMARLERAAALARGGDHRYLASPAVDSYHSVWFELHEDLILLSGRTRAEEAAAGRA